MRSPPAPDERGRYGQLTVTVEVEQVELLPVRLQDVFELTDSCEPIVHMVSQTVTDPVWVWLS